VQPDVDTAAQGSRVGLRDRAAKVLNGQRSAVGVVTGADRRWCATDTVSSRARAARGTPSQTRCSPLGRRGRAGDTTDEGVLA
jgi:hypothetical protein